MNEKHSCDFYEILQKKIKNYGYKDAEKNYLMEEKIEDILQLLEEIKKLKEIKKLN